MTEHRVPRLHRIAVLAVAPLLGLIVSCGVQTGDSTFDELDGDALGGLNNTTSTTTTTTTTTTILAVPDSSPVSTVPPTTEPPLPSATVAVYFINRGSLSPVTFEVDPLAGLNELIQLLEEGPANEGPGLRRESFVAEGLIVGTPSTDGGVIRVELDAAAFREISRNNQRQAIAQIVVTLLSNTPAVGQVSFTIDGDPLLVPADGGSREAASVDDFDSLLGVPRSTTTTTAATTIPTVTVVTATVVTATTTAPASDDG